MAASPAEHDPKRSSASQAAGESVPGHVYRHSNRDSLAQSLAQSLAEDLRSAIEARGRASLVLSGGSTPVPLLRCLRGVPLRWAAVDILLVDERWVDADDPRSNESMIRRELINGEAAEASFPGLPHRHLRPDAAAAACTEALSEIPRPFDAVISGMGDDGHFASLFPESPDLAEGLSLRTAARYMAMAAPSEPRERISMNLPSMLETRRLILHITGAAKWELFAQARSGAKEGLPITALLRQSERAVEVHWAP
jgi:6-phosphogluconolactonase